MICWQVRVSKLPKQIDADLGSGAKRWAVSMFMTDIKADITKQISVEWTRKRPAPLLPEDVTFRFEGNKVLETDTAGLTLQDFYAYYSTPSMAPIYISKVPLVWKHHTKSKMPLLCLEMYIDFDSWSDRMETTENDDRHRSVLTKRARHDENHFENSEADVTARKRRHIGTMKSQFRLSTRTELSVIVTQSRVILKKIICSLDESTADRTFEAVGEIIQGQLSDTPMSSGSMKHAYDLNTSDGRFITKRFFRLGGESESDESHSDNTLDIHEHNIQIQAELSRLVIGQWFLAAFFKDAKEKGVVVDTSIMFADAFLGQEDCTVVPSTASGVNEFDPERIMWLIEKRRPMTVTCYSGTLLHPSKRRDLRSLTIFAFAHFVFGHSNQQMVFADIQGSPTSVKGRDILVLFDIMTHTVDGDSGVGDFGKDGMQTFRNDHTCGAICVNLGFDDQIPLEFKLAVDSTIDNEGLHGAGKEDSPTIDDH